MKSLEEHLTEIEKEYGGSNWAMVEELAQCRYDLEQMTKAAYNYMQCYKHLPKLPLPKIVLPISGPTNIPRTPQYVEPGNCPKCASPLEEDDHKWYCNNDNYRQRYSWCDYVRP